MNLEDNLTPKPPLAEGVWTNYSIARTGKRVTMHTTEKIEDVLYLAEIHFGEDGRMESKTLTRADLVKG